MSGPTADTSKGDSDSRSANRTANPTGPTIAELDWLANTYRGDSMRQLSARSLIAGFLLGGVMSLSNLYVGLKLGWGLMVTITSSLLAFATFQVLQRVVPAWRKDHFTLLENYTMSSAASAAGYMASAGLVSAIPALYMLHPERTLAPWQLMAWIASVSFLGLFMAIPVKRQLVNIEQLPFPEGTATASTLASMHASGGEAMSRAFRLIAAGITGAIVKFAGDGFRELAKHNLGDSLKSAFERFSIPDPIPLFPGKVAETLKEKFDFAYPGGVAMFAAGAIMGPRAGVWLLFGSVFFFGVVGQVLYANEIVANFGQVRRWVLWPSVALLVSSSLVQLGFRWRTILSAFGGLTRLISGAQTTTDDPIERLEAPGSWFIAGTLVSGFSCVILGHQFFGISYWMGIIAVVMTFFLSLVAARSNGETGITPIGAMGKITQLAFSAIAPRNTTINLMTASITSGAASHAGDLVNDLKTGYLLGGNPRKQVLSQCVGVVAGTLACVPIFCILITPDVIQQTSSGDPRAQFAMPAAMVWRSVAELLAKGIEALPPGAFNALLVGVATGATLAVVDEFCPRKYRWFVPSSTAIGIAGTLSPPDAIAMFVGSMISMNVVKRDPKSEEDYVLPIASGLIAGESLMGVGIAISVLVPGLWSQLFGK